MSQISVQSYMMVPRILESTLFFIVILLVNRKYSKVPIKNRPLIHKLFLSGLIGWFIYIFLDIFIYSLGATSFPRDVSITASGYDFTYPSLFIANILRDFAMAGILVESLSYLLVPFAIYYGKNRVQQILHNRIFQLTCTIFSLYIIFNENLEVRITDQSVIITESYGGSGMLSFLIVTTVFCISAILMTVVFQKTLKEEQLINNNNTLSKNYKEIRKQEQLIYRQKMFRLSVGIYCMGIGYIWAIFWNVMALFFPILTEPTNFLLISIILHLFWMISPIFIYLGLRMQTPSKC